MLSGPYDRECCVRNSHSVISAFAGARAQLRQLQMRYLPLHHLRLGQASLLGIAAGYGSVLPLLLAQALAAQSYIPWLLHHCLSPVPARTRS